MEAKLFTGENEMKITLNNGVEFVSQEGESKEDFTKRVEEVVDRDYLETLELTEEKAPAKKKPATKKPAATKKPVAKKKPAAKKEPKPKKELPTLEEALDKAKKAKANVETICTFVPFRTAIKVKGEVKQVVIDKRVNKAYYRINALKDGKLYHISVDNETFKVDEAATEKLAQKREAEKKKKEEAKKKAAEAKKKAAAEKKKAAAKKPATKKPATKKAATPSATKGKGYSRQGTVKS